MNALIDLAVPSNRVFLACCPSSPWVPVGWSWAAVREAVDPHRQLDRSDYRPSVSPADGPGSRRGSRGEHRGQRDRDPSAEAEAQRQLTREIETVREDRKRVRNRIQGVLATQGVRLPLTGDFLARVRTAHTGDGRPLPVAFRMRLEREWAALEAVETRLGALTATRDEHIATGADRVATVALQLCTLRAVAETSAAVCSAELFGTRTFDNGRQLGASSGWCRSPTAVTRRCGTRASAQPAAPSFDACGSRSHGAGCAGNRKH
jgi:transposase